MPTIKFYPFDRDTTKFTPEPEPASRNLPEWYKKQPAEIKMATSYQMGQVGSTVKKCMPIFDAMTAGYVFKAPCDIYLDGTNPNKLTYSIPASLKQYEEALFATHHRDQYSEYPINSDREHKDLLRIMPFWSAKTPEGYATLVVPPLHGDLGPLRAIPGLIDTDKFITDGHFSFLVDRTFVGVVKRGTPLAQLIPFKREDWEMELVPQSIADKEVNSQRLLLRSVFVNAYKTLFRSKKDYK